MIINLSFHFDGSLERKERWQYPLDVIRELLLNAVVHRDYKHSTDIVIKIFDDRIIFINPGTLYGSLNLGDIERDDYVSSIRNKLLAEAFYLMGDIERYGTGFVRIRKMLRDNPEVTYDLKEVGDFFQARLYSQSVRSSDLRKDPIDLRRDLKKDLKEKYGLSVNQITIVEAVLENKYITQNALSERVGITAKNIRTNMSKLKDKGVLKRIGPLKGGYWEVEI